METPRGNCAHARFYVFKSYYVVWKLMNTEGTIIEDISLNRTMQYGNPFLLMFLRLLYGRLNRTMQYGNITTHIRDKFLKPCLNRTMQYGNLYRMLLLNPSHQFKSYYVVWKLPTLSFATIFEGSLNRTMQYGNMTRYLNTDLGPVGLNRTMQYGNMEK